jgi:hypothetical protein
MLRLVKHPHAKEYLLVNERGISLVNISQGKENKWQTYVWLVKAYNGYTLVYPTSYQEGFETVKEARAWAEQILLERGNKIYIIRDTIYPVNNPFFSIGNITERGSWWYAEISPRFGKYEGVTKAFESRSLALEWLTSIFLKDYGYNGVVRFSEDGTAQYSEV